MKKLIIIIIILATIFVGMIVYKNLAINTNNNISVEEIEKIETYITKIYMWKEVTEEALPTFENINQANEIWIWEAVKKNLEEYELTYEQLQEKAIELFGSSFEVQFPKEGTEFLIYDNETNKYYAVGIGLDEEEDCFLLNKIERTNNGFEVEIIEYLEDYSNALEGQANLQPTIIVRNLDNEEIGKVNVTEEGNTKEIVKNNIERFSKKKIIIKQEENKIYVEKVIKE